MHTTCPTKGLYPEHRKNSQNSTVKTKTLQLAGGQNILMDISLKKIYR